MVYPRLLFRFIYISSDKPKGQQLGLTLIELIVVLIILIGIGGILIPTLSNVSVRGADGISRDPNEVTTMTTMNNVRDALIGRDSTDMSYRRDLGRLPSRLSGLIQNIDDERPFIPSVARGWRGPYIVDSGTRYGNFITEPNVNGFPNYPSNDPAILDGFGSPLILQQFDSTDARLVSAGANRILETDPNDPIDSNRGDDVVLFLFLPDPNL